MMAQGRVIEILGIHPMGCVSSLLSRLQITKGVIGNWEGISIGSSGDEKQRNGVVTRLKRLVTYSCDEEAQFMAGGRGVDSYTNALCSPTRIFKFPDPDGPD